ncbi:hypothetical protein J6590_051462 [Homalodisca vitripennis]|nr:hypothetical protein J6590_051462 [Homalodisca vitripennis]
MPLAPVTKVWIVLHHQQGGVAGPLCLANYANPSLGHQHTVSNALASLAIGWDLTDFHSIELAALLWPAAHGSVEIPLRYIVDRVISTFSTVRYQAQEAAKETGASICTLRVSWESLLPDQERCYKDVKETNRD